MTVANTPTSSPLFGVHIPENKSRELVDSLLDDGEQQALMDVVAMETDRKEDDLPEMVCGWGCSISLPKPPVSASKRNVRRKFGKQYPDIDTSKITVRCVSEDYNPDHNRAAWKANVEPGTYRYIANNGIYRSTKFASTGTDWVTAKRSRHSERITTTPEIRQAQKTLRKDLDQHFKSSEQPKPESQPIPQQHQQHHHQQQPRPSATLTPPAPPGTKMPLTAQQAAKQLAKDPKLVKSASDLFVENFSSRMTALEKEINAGTSNTKPPESPPKPGTSPRTAVSAIHSVHKSRHNDNSAPDAAKFLAQQADDISKDVFTIKPVTRAEHTLKPLEKLTPQQKLIERRTSESDKSSVATNSNPESPALSTSFMTAMNAFAQIHHQYHRDGHQSKSSPATFRSHQRLHNHYNNGGSGHFSSNSSDTDSMSSVRNALTMTKHDIEKMRMGSTINQVGRKDHTRFITSTGKAKVPGMSIQMAKPFGGQKRGVVGYRQSSIGSFISQANNNNPPISHSHMLPTAPEDLTSPVSDSESDTSPLIAGRGIRESKSQSMSLPEISGKRLPVTSTTQRML